MMRLIKSINTLDIIQAGHIIDNSVIKHIHIF